MNLNTLLEVLGEDALKEMIIKNLDKNRLQRRIILPSRKCLRKVICHYFGVLADDGILSWEEIMAELRGSFKSLKEIDISRKRVKMLYLQREKEIANGQ